MSILLDTHTAIWQLGMTDGGKIGPETRTIFEAADAVYVSSISIVEMQIKTMLGKLDVPRNMRDRLEEAGNKILDFSAAAGDGVRDFPALVRHDPFDRMLLAQAQSENLVFVTADQALLELKLDFVVDARV